MKEISVVIPAYNAERTVESAIRSALRQSYAPTEIIVVDDCSRDSTAQLIRSMAAEEPRIRFLENEENHGVSYSRNRGIREAKGEYVAFLDSDDLWMPEKLEKQMALVDSPSSPDMVYTSYGYMTAEGHPFRYVFRVPGRTTVGEMLKKNVMSTSGLLIRRELLLQYPFRSDVAHEDLHEWITLLRSGAVCAGVRETMHMVRLTGKESRSGVKTKAAANRMKLYDELGVTGIRKLFCWCCYAFSAGIKYASMKLMGADMSRICQ